MKTKEVGFSESTEGLSGVGGEWQAVTQEDPLQILHQVGRIFHLKLSEECCNNQIQ